MAIACGAKPRTTTCPNCGQKTRDPRECDWKVGQGKTCDRKLCARCTFEPHKGKDLCPEHKKAFEAWRRSRLGGVRGLTDRCGRGLSSTRNNRDRRVRCACLRQMRRRHLQSLRLWGAAFAISIPQMLRADLYDLRHAA